MTRKPPIGRGRAVRARWMVLGLVWLAFALRAGGLLAQSLWRDEVDVLIFATRPLDQLLSTFRTPGENGPLFFLAVRPWLQAAGCSEFALRFPSALAGALAVPVVYRLASRLAGRAPALITALLLAVSPYAVWYGQDAKMYALLTLLAPASLLLTVETAQRGGWLRWLSLYLVTSVMFYVHLLAALVAPVQVLWLLVLPGGVRPGRRVCRALGYACALLLPYLPLLAWQPGMWLSSFQTGHPFAPLPDIFAVLAGAFTLGIAPYGGAVHLLPAMLALVAGVLLWGVQARHPAAGMGGRGRAVALLLIWLLLPPLMVFGVSLGMPIFTERYLIWTLPAFLALIAMGVVALARAWRPLGGAVLAAILVLGALELVRQDRQPIKSDFRAAAAHVLQHMQAGDLVIYQIPYVRFVFSYYASGDHDPADAAWRGLDGPYTNRGMSEAEVDAWMRQGAGGAPAAWLVASEASMWDERALTRAWLDAHGVATHHAAYARVAVTRYDLATP